MEVKNIPKEVMEVCRCLNNNGYETYVVGGAVRDYYIGRTPKDWDISTSAEPNVVVSMFDKVVPTGIKYGTVTVHIGNMQLEVTTYRNDGKYSDNRRPDEVSFAETIEEDLSRRDFRMNAMALDPLNGRMIDPFGGCINISNKIINTVGMPENRFAEDALRMMRAVRFASQLNFNLDRSVSRCILRTRRNLECVSTERIRDELLKILASSNPRHGITLLCDVGLMELIIPQFIRTKGCLQNKKHSFDVFNHSINVVSALPPDPILRLAGLLHDIGKPDTQVPLGDGNFKFPEHDKLSALYAEGITKRLKLSNNDVNRVVHLIKYHMRLLNISKTDCGIRKLIKELGPENVEEFMLFHRADMFDRPKKQVLLAELEKDYDRIRKVLISNPVINSSGLVINGHDIMDHFQIEGGKEVGKMINYAVDVVMKNPELNTKDQLLKMLGEWMERKDGNNE